MATQLTFTLDDDFTDYDLKIVIAAQSIAIALYNIVHHIQRMDRGKIEYPASSDALLEELVRFINEEMDGLPELI